MSTKYDVKKEEEIARHSCYVTDCPTADDIMKEMKRLGASYVPEWDFDEKNPDIGTVLAILFANQMSENIHKMNRMLDKYRIEFVNMLGLSLLPARPAHTMVVMKMEPGISHGVHVPAGTKLLGSSERSSKNLVFETIHDLYVTNVKLKEILAISEKFQKVNSLLLQRGKLPLFPEDGEIREEQAAAWDTPLPLFEYRKPDIREQAVIIYHSYLFDTDTDAICLKMEHKLHHTDYGRLFSNCNEYKFYYDSEEGLSEFQEVTTKNDWIFLKKSGRMRKKIRKDKEVSAIVLRPCRPPQAEISLTDIFITCRGKEKGPEFTGDGNVESEPENCMPFGRQLSLFQEFYIGESGHFNQKQAEITLEFQVSFGTTLVTYEREDQSLPVIKRKPRKQVNSVMADAWIQETSLEYFNGTGWKRLKTEEPVKEIFAGEENAGIRYLTFLCPTDWDEVSILSYTGKCLRMRVIKADNCYLQPCTHHYPILNNIKISYDYKNISVKPECIERIDGSKREDLTSRLLRKEAIPLFHRFPYHGNTMLFGFHEKFEDGPISLLFSLKDSVTIGEIAVSYEYSGKNGFKPLKVTDHTRNLNCSGNVIFMPPADMAKMEIEGQELYWIRMKDDSGYFERETAYHPVLKELSLNSVTVHNVETLEEREYYMDAVRPYASFPLYGNNILSADVWVNEAESPDQEAFYVKWKEVPDFNHSSAGDRHYSLDRKNNRILFGDGVNVRIPENTKDTAFKATLRCCDGGLGNVEPGTITESMSNFLFIDHMENPIGGYGGCNQESVRHALERGSNLIRGRNRLITGKDFMEEILRFSDAIEKAACIPGQRTIHFILFMKDYKKGSHSFRQVKEGLLSHLLRQCDLSLQLEDIHIEEPVYVFINVQVWAWAESIDRIAALQKELKHRIEQFLEPAASESGKGWEIGELPREEQIRMLINSMGSFADISDYTVTARYMDTYGEHEKQLKEMKKRPDMMCVNGEHKIHVMLKD